VYLQSSKETNNIQSRFRLEAEVHCISAFFIEGAVKIPTDIFWFFIVVFLLINKNHQHIEFQFF